MSKGFLGVYVPHKWLYFDYLFQHGFSKDFISFFCLNLSYPTLYFYRSLSSFSLSEFMLNSTKKIVFINIFMCRLRYVFGLDIFDFDAIGFLSIFFEILLPLHVVLCMLQLRVQIIQLGSLQSTWVFCPWEHPELFWVCL